jgi:hypothetical protein
MSGSKWILEVHQIAKGGEDYNVTEEFNSLAQLRLALSHSPGPK